MPAMLGRRNKIFKILFMVAFCHIIALHLDPNTYSNQSLGLEPGLGLELG